MTHYRKKPIVIKAVQWDGTYLQAKQLEAELELTSLGMTAHPPSNSVSWWKIATLEDGHVVSQMDWIITGVKGEHYPCKPDIFELTYEAAIAQPEQTAQAGQSEPVAWVKQEDLNELKHCNYMFIGADSPAIWWPNSGDVPNPDQDLIPLYAHPAPVRQPLTAEANRAAMRKDVKALLEKVAQPKDKP